MSQLLRRHALLTIPVAGIVYLQWINTANTNVATLGKIFKSGGGNAWNSGGYIDRTYSGSWLVSGYILNSAKNGCFGWCTNQNYLNPNDSNYDKILFQWASGNCQIKQDGAVVYGPVAINSDAKLTFGWNESNYIFKINDAIIYTSAKAKVSGELSVVMLNTDTINNGVYNVYQEL